MDVVVRPHLLSERDLQVIELAPGATLAEIVAAYPWPPGVQAHAVVLLDRQVVPREWWPRIRPKDGTRIDLTIGMHGGGNGKQMLALVASIAISVMAPWAATAVFGMTAGTLGAGVVAAGIAVVGNLALAALFKPPPTAVMPSNNQSSKAYTFQGQSNAFKPYGVLPRVLGVHRVYPDVVGVPYTEVHREPSAGDPNRFDDVQYLRALYSFGYGGVIIDDIRIGENPLSAYTLDYAVHQDFKRGDPLTWFVSDVAVDQYSFSLKQNVPISVRTRQNTDSAVLDLYFPMGLGVLNAQTGGINDLTATNRIEIRDVALGAGAPWLPATAAKSVSVSDGKMGGVYEGAARPNPVKGGWAAWAGQDNWEVFRWSPIGAPGGWVQFGNMRLTLDVATPTYMHTTTGLPQQYTIPNWAGGQFTSEMPFLYGTGGAADWIITRHQPTPFAASVTIGFPHSGQWEIRVTRLDADSTGTNVLNDRTLTTLRSFGSQSEPPVVPDVWTNEQGQTVYQTVALLEVRVKATDQLSGTIGNINALVATKVPRWDGSGWVAPSPTVVEEVWSNPAWEYLELLRGPPNKRPVMDSRIDLPAFKAWADRCDRIEAGFTERNARCNFVVDKPYTLWQLLNSVAASGRAMPTMRDNKYSVIVDEAIKPEVQIFSPRNSWGMSATRRYLPQPHALRVKWIDPASNYQEAVVEVYADGYSAANATVFEDLELFGCTSAEQAHRDGRVWFARAQLQVEEFSLQTDIENVVCTRGDLIGIAHDVLSVGGWSARIKALNGKQVQFDSELKPFQEPWALRHRSDAGVISSNLAFTSVGGGWFDVPMLPASAKVGDLVLYGTAGVEQGRYLVKAVTPGNDLTAEIACIEYAPGIYTAELGPIPPYVPQGQSAESFLPAPVRSLTASVNAWNLGQFPHASVTLSWSPPTSALQPSLYLISEVLVDGTVRELGRTASLTFVALPDVETWRAPYAGALVTFSVVAQWPGVAGPAATTTAQLPSGVLVAPAAPLDLEVVPQPRFVLAAWATPPSVSVAYYAVRYGAAGTAWDTLAASEAKLKASRIELAPPNFTVGDYLVFVSLEDVYGARSAPVSAPFSVLAPRSVTVVGTAVENTVFMRWGSLSGVPAGDWSAQTTFAIEYYEVQKTLIPPAGRRAERRLANGMGVIPEGVETAQDKAGEVPQMLGRYAGEFAVLNEQQEGMWRYCMRGVDVAGNTAPYSCTELLVSAPDNYFLLDTLANFLNDPACTNLNAIKNLDATWLAPVDTAQTWQSHFASHGWDTPQDQVDAGAPMYAQPPDTTKAVFSWSHDYGQNLPGLKLATEVIFAGYGGNPNVVVIEFAKANAGDAWTEIGRAATQVVAMLPPGTRYVRIDVEVTSEAAANLAVALIERAQFVLDIKFVDDSGVVTVDADGVTNVVFNRNFLDVRSVQLTSADPAIAYARYEVLPDQQSMNVYAFNASAVPTGGKVAWQARGV